VVFRNLGTAFHAIMHEQGQAFSVCLPNKVSKPGWVTRGCRIGGGA